MVDGRTKTGRLINQIRGKPQKQIHQTQEERTPIASGMYLPNHSGISNHPEILNNFVKKSGDTMEGPLNIDCSPANATPLTAYSNSGDGTFKFGRNSNEYFSIISSDTYIELKHTNDQDSNAAHKTKYSINTTSTSTEKEHIWEIDDTDLMKLGESQLNLLVDLDLNGNDLVGETKEFDRTILFPYGAYDVDTQVFLFWARKDLTISKIQIELDTSSYEVAGDLKYANDFQAMASATVINDFDTTSGKRTDTSITSASVAAGKAIYIQFDSQPNTNIAQMHVHIEYSFD